MFGRVKLAEPRSTSHSVAWFPRAVSWLSGGAGLIGAIAIVVITIGLALDVLLRTVRGQGIPGMLDAIGPLLAIAAFLGLGVTEAKGEHIALTIFVRRLKPRIRQLIYVIGTSITILFITWMIVAGFAQAIQSIGTGEVRPGIVNIPLWPARVAVVIGCAVLVLQLVVTLIDAIRGLIAGGPVGLWVEREAD